MSNDLSKIQNVITTAVSSIGMISLYTGGVNLSKSNPIYHNQIFISTIIISYISPYILEASTTYVLKKYNNSKKVKTKK